MLEVQLQQQQEALKQANDSRKQRDNDKVLSLERQLVDVNDRLQSETDSYNKYKKMYSDMTQVWWISGTSKNVFKNKLIWTLDLSNERTFESFSETDPILGVFYPSIWLHSLYWFPMMFPVSHLSTGPICYTTIVVQLDTMRKKNAVLLLFNPLILTSTIVFMYWVKYNFGLL